MKNLMTKNTKEDTINIVNDRMVNTLMNKKTVKKKRSCLLCGKAFNSTGPFNRRCPRCSRLVALGKAGNFSDTATYRVGNRSSAVSFFDDYTNYG